MIAVEPWRGLAGEWVRIRGRGGGGWVRLDLIPDEFELGY